MGSLPACGLGESGLEFCGADVHPERTKTEEDHRSIVVISSEMAYSSRPGYRARMDR